VSLAAVDGHTICLANQTFNETCGDGICVDPPLTNYCDLTCSAKQVWFEYFFFVCLCVLWFVCFFYKFYFAGRFLLNSQFHMKLCRSTSLSPLSLIGLRYPRTKISSPASSQTIIQFPFASMPLEALLGSNFIRAELRIRNIVPMSDSTTLS
jgi:hypothetical protein